MTKGCFILEIDIEDIVTKYYISKDDNDIELLDLHTEPDQGCILFADPNNFPIKYWLTMKNISNNEKLPSYTNSNCWWDKNSFGTHPLGLPISYNCKDDSFETEGIFCSFACMKAYLNKRLNNPYYKNSPGLIHLLYFKLFKKNIERITPSPDWRLLKEYGGELSIMDLRRMIGKTIFESTINHVKPVMYTINDCLKEIDVN